MATFSPELAAQAAKINKAELGEKTRVHALAKMLGASSGDVLQILSSQGVSDKRPASTVTRQQAEMLLDSLTVAPGDEGSDASKAPKKTSPKAKKSTAKKSNAKSPAAKKTAAKKSTTAKKTAVKGKTAQKTAELPTEESTDAQVEAPAELKTETPAPLANTAPSEVSQDTPEEKPADNAAGNAGEEAAAKSENSERPKRTRRRTVKKAAPKKAAAKQAEQEQTEPQVAKQETPAQDEPQRDALDDAVDLVIAPLFNHEDARGDERAEKGAAESSSAESDATEAEIPAAHDNPKRKVRRVRRVVRRGVSGAEADSQQDELRQSEPQPEESPAESKPERIESEVASEEDKDKLHPAERDEADIVDEPVRFKGSTRLESRRRWKAENRDDSRQVVSRSEFLARRESVERVMVVRDSERTDHPGLTTQVGVVEDGMLVEHFVTSDTQNSMVGNVYLGTVQNVLSSMEAAFIDLGTGRNAVLYAGEMNWHSPHLHSKNRRIESALRSGDQIMVQVIKDPVGHKGARLTARISFAGRYLVYFPGGTTAGISRKLPEAERKRLKAILSRVIPGEGGAIIRTAAENASEEHIGEDVNRLHDMWENVLQEEEKARSSKGTQPVTLYEEPNMLIKVIRDILNRDFSQLIVDGDKSWATVRDYVSRMAADLKDRVVKWHPEQHGGQDIFEGMELDQQLSKALSRKVWLPSGGHLVFDKTEAMTVIDVNTGSFIGSGGNLEETVTQNNLESAEEIVRQMRLRDLGGMIVVDFIDMVLEENRDLVLRRLTEYLGRDRTRHKVSEVTSLGLVQMTRKRLGIGLLETFSTECEACDGRGVILHADPVEHEEEEDDRPRRDHGNRKERQQARREKQRREQSQERAHTADRDVDKSDVDNSDVNKAADNAPEKTQEKAPEKPSAKQDAPQRTRRQAQRSKRSERTTDSEASQDQTAVDSPRAADSRDQGNDESDSRRNRGTSASQRRRVRRVVRRHTPADTQTSAKSEANENDHGDQRVVSPKGGNGAGKSPRHTSAKATSSADRVAAQRSESRRRGRRVVRKVTSPAHEDSVQNAPEQNIPEKKGAQQQGSKKSFEQAREQFESSPRRKRQTRGNSRSDIPPKREDFAADSPAAESGNSRRGGKAAAQPERNPVNEKPQRGGSGAASEEKKGRRRRVVRRSN